MRLVCGAALIAHGIQSLRAGLPIGSATLDSLEIIAGIPLLAGLWTPVSGSLVAVLGVWCATTRPVDPWAGILLGTIGAALALVGPGAWSVDARLFGWKRIDLGNR